MAIKIIRYQSTHVAGSLPAEWGVVFDRRIAPLSGRYLSSGDLITLGMPEIRSRASQHASISLDEVKVLSPITSNQQFICQGANYESHVRESGMDPNKLPFNTIFTKASSCLVGAFDDVVRPRHVRLLDYEIELGLVMATDMRGRQQVTANELHRVLAGVTIVNDVSARDVQLPQGQFYKGKSYRSFGPVGPYLVLLEPNEWELFPHLRMKLSVNGAVRQNDVCGSMIFKPHETLSELSGLQDLSAGDLIATGTPAGCAAKAPSKAAMFIAKHFLSDSTKWRAFIKNGTQNPLYLQANDLMELTIRTDDGQLDLGQQRNRVIA